MAEPGQSSPAAIPPEEPPELAKLREQIDAADRAILEQLNRRARLVQDIGRLKAESGVAVYAAARERDIVERLRRDNAGPFPDEGVASVFREVISATRSLERVLQVAYLGPAGTFAHLAASRQFGELADLVGFPSIPDVFAAVERDKADLGMVPLENTTEGVVTQTLDAFTDFEVTICGEVLLPISLNLLSQSGRAEDVRRIASNPQPLAQCRGWLDRNFQAAERVETASTAAAARMAAAEGNVAAIGSAIAGRAYGLRTVAAAIEDRRDNTTRFVLIGKRAPAPTGGDLTSVVFTIPKDEAGALHRLLEPFARCGVNLTSIQQRPMKGKPWEYLFFVDLEGHLNEGRVSEALAQAARIAHSYRVLGSFPRALRRVQRGEGETNGPDPCEVGPSPPGRRGSGGGEG
jgi:chorismate mutase/prephenate dehydratase